MNLNENLNNSFAYAQKMFSDFGRLLILVVIDLIPLVNFIGTGYAMRCLRETPGTDAPPTLEKYGDLFVDGLKLFVVAFIYMLIPLIIMAIGAATLVIPWGTRSGPGWVTGGNPLMGMTLLGGIGLLFMLVAMALAFLMLIILGTGIAHMIKTNNLGKAFAFGEILKIIGKIGWGKYIGWVILVAVIGFIVGVITAAIPVLGWVIGAIISPSLTVFFFRSLGLLYSEGAQQPVPSP